MFTYIDHYTENAIDNFANALDYVYVDQKKDIKNFIDMFIKCGLAKEYYLLNPVYVLGLSGKELVKKTYELNNIIYKERRIKKTYKKSIAYFVGVISLTYCYRRDIPIEIFFKKVKIDDLFKLYYPLHEADITKIIKILDEYLKKKSETTNLAYYRKILKLTQKELADLSGISVRSISLYEEKEKDISKASYATVEKIARALHTEPKNIIEY